MDYDRAFAIIAGLKDKDWLLTEWEIDFIDSIENQLISAQDYNAKFPLSERQKDTLESLEIKHNALGY